MKSVTNIIDECVKKGGYTINDIVTTIIEYGYTKEEALEGINDFAQRNASPPDILY